MSRTKTAWNWFATGVGWVILIGLTIFLLEEVVRVALYTIPEWGFWTAVTDGVMLYKVGELLILGSLVAFALFNRKLPAERMTALVGQWRWVVWAGALLNFLAIFSLDDRVYWWPWALILAVIGGILPLLMMRWTRTRAIWPARIMVPPLVLLLLLAYGVAYITSGYFMAPIAAPFPTPADTEAGRWRQDLDYLAGELPRLHKNAYHTVSQERFEALVSNLHDRIPEMEPEQIAAGFHRVVAAVGDGHTTFYDRQAAADRELFPINAFWFDEGIFITATCQALKPALGGRILTLGGMPIEFVADSLGTLVPHESQAILKHRVPQFLSATDFLSGLGLVDSIDSVAVEIETVDGDTIDLILQPDSDDCGRDELVRLPESPPLFKTRRSEDFWHEMWPDLKAVYFRLSRFDYPSSLPDYSERLFDSIGTRGIEYLIIDFRDNPGGSSLIFDRFLELLRENPLLNQPGHAYVLVNRASFSSAVLCAAKLRRDTHALLAGEEMSGRLNHYGEMRWFNLPNRDARVYYSTKHFTVWPDSLPPVAIDLPMPVTAEACLAGEDPVLDTVLQLIESDLAGSPVANKDVQPRQ